MQRSSECERHFGTKLRFFCREELCCKKVCQFCVQESHASHRVTDLVSLSSEIRDRKSHQAQDLRNTLGELKTILSDLDRLDKKALDKAAGLYAEEKKFEESFEARVRRWKSIIQERQHRIHKGIVRLQGRIESSREFAQKFEVLVPAERDLMNIMEWTDDDIKHQLQSEGASKPAIASGQDIRLEYSQIVGEMGQFEDVHAESFKDEIFVSSKGAVSSGFDAMFMYSTVNGPRPVAAVPQTAKAKGHHGLSIKIPESPTNAGQQQQQQSLVEPAEVNTKKLEAEINGKIRERTARLESLELDLKMKRKEIQILEKTRERLLKGNKELQLQIEKQNKVFSENISAFSLSPSPRPAAPEQSHSPSVPKLGMKYVYQQSADANRIRAAEGALTILLRQHHVEIEKASLEPLIGKLTALCDQLAAQGKSESPGPEKKPKSIPKKPAPAGPSPQKLKKELDGLKLANQTLEETVASVKKELSINRVLYSALELQME